MDTNMQREAPEAVIRQTVQRLGVHRKLNVNEQATVLNALRKTGIDITRVLANMSRETLETMLTKI